MSDPGPDSSPPTLRQRLVGEVDHLGWWIVPAFLVVGLAGAVMAGTLAIVYYSQQVGDLESQTREGRQELQGAVDEVQQVRDRALAEIRSEVDAVRETMARGLPVDDVGTYGLVVIEARVNTPAPESATVQPQGQAPDGAPDVLAQDQPTQPPTQPRTSPAEPQQPPPVRPRLGVGFAVAVEDGATYLATSYGLVHDGNARAGVVEEVRVTTPAGDRVTGTVHSWDEQRGIALVRAPAGDLPIPDWRPRGEQLAVGDQVTVVGVTPRFDPVQLQGTVGWVGTDALVTSLPATEFLRGAPVLDATGRVVAVHAPAYQPFGSAAGTAQAAAPVGLFCDRMLDGCETLEAEATARPTEEPTG